MLHTNQHCKNDDAINTNSNNEQFIPLDNTVHQLCSRVRTMHWGIGYCPISASTGLYWVRARDSRKSQQKIAENTKLLWKWQKSWQNQGIKLQAQKPL